MNLAEVYREEGMLEGSWIVNEEEGDGGREPGTPSIFIVGMRAGQILLFVPRA